MNEQYRPAEGIEPFWFVRIDDEWVFVDGVLETEAPDGGERIRFFFIDRPAMVVAKGDLVMSRPPDDSSSAASGPGGSTLG
jgi:hypothetical protein